MSNYYKEQKMAFHELRNYIDSARESRKDFSIPALLMMLTERFEVSERALKKRLELVSKVYEDMIIDKDMVRWSE